MARYRFASFGRTTKARLARIGRQAFGAFVAAGVAASAPVAAQEFKLDRALNEEVVQVPVLVETANRVEQWSLVATTFHPPGAGPFPLVVLNHGSPGSLWERQSMGRYRPLPQIREFTKRGFAVIVPMRRGYGDTGGPWAERFGACIAPDYYRAARESEKDVIAAVEFAQALPFVKADRVILVGQSAGGIAAIAAASANPPGVIGVVNFSGGRGGRPYTNPGDPCVAGNMTEAIAKHDGLLNSFGFDGLLVKPFETRQGLFNHVGDGRSARLGQFESVKGARELVVVAEEAVIRRGGSGDD